MRGAVLGRFAARRLFSRAKAGEKGGRAGCLDAIGAAFAGVGARAIVRQ